MNLPRESLHRSWTPAEDRILVRRRYQGARDKQIARELQRTPPSVNGRFTVLRKKLETRHPDILERHRQQEVELLERLIEEANGSELLADESL